MDWHQLWEITSAPDNVPITSLLFLVPFFVWYGLRQSFANDRLIAQLEADPAMAKTHHRKTQPWRPEWVKEVHVWPFLLRVEFLAAVIVTIILFVWSITLNAPLEDPANPALTMNPAKAPWYFLGLQEMLVYFDPWMSGVVLPTLIILGLMAIPYMDINPLGNGYYTFKQRKFAILTFCFGFIGLWVLMVIIGTFIRGPGWQWFWPGMTWDHNRLIYEVNRNLDEVAAGMFSAVGLNSVALWFGNMWFKAAFGAVAMAVYAVLAGLLCHKLITATEFNRKVYQRMTLVQYLALQFFLVIMLLLPVKIILRHVFRIKYLWVTPWFNI
jgi:Cytochrome b(C-terminal)/b6/petD